MLPILQDPATATRLFEAILYSPNGRRSLSRLARTCHALSEPALEVLWKELDSIVPILGLFPATVLRKSRRPGLGLSRIPEDSEWDAVLRYSDKIQRIVYDETANNVTASVFPIIDEHRPRLYVLPNLQELVWKAETAAGLDRCAMFLSPRLCSIHVEIGANFKRDKINRFLYDMSSRTRLTSFSFNSPTSLPDAFTELLDRQDELERVVLNAPGALSSEVGRWASCLPYLKTLQLDLTGRSPIAVEGFFDEIHPRSGASTPSSIVSESTDSGVFSSGEYDFAELRKSALRLTGADLPSKASFAQLRRVQLAGEVGNIAVFFRHLSSPLTHIDLVVEDPPDNADWQDLSHLICELFGDSLQSLTISASSASRYADLVRSTSRSEGPAKRLSLEHLSDLNKLVRLEIDLPESIAFLPADLDALADACPKLEVLRLCPLARFAPSTGGPKITLESLSLLTKRCKYLHTIAAVVNAAEASPTTLNTQSFSSRSLLRLYLGGSWVSDPLPVAVLLSHMAPRLETLRFFQERNRVGFNEANAKNWQVVIDMLPYLQAVRKSEKSFAKPVPETSEKAVDATVQTFSKGVQCRPKVAVASVQCSPQLVDQGTQAVAGTADMGIDATPHTADVGVDAKPVMVSMEVDATSPPELEEEGETMETMEIDEDEVERQNQLLYLQILQQLYLLPSVVALFTIFYQYMILYPMALPGKGLRTLRLTASTVTEYASRVSRRQPALLAPEATESPQSDTLSELSMDTSALLSSVEDSSSHTYAYAQESQISEPKEDDNLSNPGTQEDAELIVGTWAQSLSQTRANNVATRQLRLAPPTRTHIHPEFIMSDNKKQEKDFTPEVEALLPEAEKLAKSGKLQESLDKIFTLEKLTRNAADLSSTTKLTKAAVQQCYDARDYPLLNSTVQLLSKKHGQLKAAIQAFVELVIGWLPEIKSKDGTERWLELLETLRTVTEGKIFLETPRARVTLLLSQHHEALSQSSTGKDSKESLQKASDLLSELQVETYSSMERREKTEFILEQMRLLIKVARQKDTEVGAEKAKTSVDGGESEWVKVRVGGRKVNEDFLKEKDNEDLKLKYYDMMIQHALHQDEYLDVAKFYYKVWETPSIKEDTNSKGKAALEHIAYYIVLAPHTNEQSDMLHHLFTDPALTKLELQYNLVKCFVTQELMRWPGIESIYGKFLRKTPVFSQEKRWEDLHTRVVEHNIRVVAAYYTRITLDRLSSLLDLSRKETEAILSRLVVGGTVFAKTDRPAGIVSFRAKRDAEDVMNDWSSDMQKLLSLVEKTWMGMNAAVAAQSRVKS